MLILRAHVGVSARASRSVAIAAVRPVTRLLSSASAAATVSAPTAGGVATLTLSRPPANTLTLKSLQSLRTSLASLEADPNVRGVVVTSASPKIFSAGIDLSELVRPDEARLREFWREFTMFFAELFGTELATAAAVDGHALGGGCIVTLSCDHRVMSRGTIGLNEAALGLPPPWWISDLLCRVVGEARGEQMLQNATTVGAELAAEIGLVDSAVAASAKGDTMPSVAVAERRLEALVAVPGRAGVKAERRARFAAAMRERLDGDTDGFVASITSASMQAELEKYASALQRKQ